MIIMILKGIYDVITAKLPFHCNVYRVYDVKIELLC